ncbi:MAG: tetratricopeptide repeat protein, partial [Bacteroidales bacterium]|nr:tetratricopeptide repeat protein [Bacteroidales bacterium]
ILAQKKADDKAKLAAATDDKAKQKAESDLATCAQVEGGVLGLFSCSTAAQCDVLINAFSGKFKENPNDMDLCNKIVKICTSKGCTDSQLYEDAVSKLIANNPTETACFGFAKMLEKKGKEDDAIDNYKKAISLAEADTMKAIYNCSIAKLLQKKGQAANARSYAREAINANPKYGLPYIIIATLYGSNPVGEDSFEKSKTYWLVIDYLQKAKAADPSVANEAQQLINRYIGSCPKKEEAFMHSVTPGMSISIGGWIGESTTARF